MLNHNIKEGLSITYEKKTTTSDAYITNDTTIDFFISTCSLMSMITDSSCRMVDKLLPQQYITVGSKMEIEHTNPTLIGETVSLIVTVEKIEGNKIFLSFVGIDSNSMFCEGKCERVIVNKDKLMEQAYKRVQNTL